VALTAIQQLEAVEAAIAAIEGGAQEYKIGWRSVRRADLVVLYQERRQLRQEVGAPFRTTVATFDGR
jgi:hypothetical protein